MDFSPTWIGIYISWTGMIVSLVMSLHAVRQAGANKRHRIATESPHFIFDRLLIQRVMHKNQEGEPVKVMTEPFPPFDRNYVPEDYAQGEPVIVEADNKGSEARGLRIVSTPDFPTELGWMNRVADGCIKGGERLQIAYAFNQARRGRREKISLHFQTVGGDKVKQSFYITHGALETERL